MKESVAKRVIIVARTGEHNRRRIVKRVLALLKARLEVFGPLILPSKDKPSSR